MSCPGCSRRSRCGTASACTSSRTSGSATRSERAVHRPVTAVRPVCNTETVLRRRICGVVAFEVQAHRGNDLLAMRRLLAATPSSIELDVGLADGSWWSRTTSTTAMHRGCGFERALDLAARDDGDDRGEVLPACDAVRARVRRGAAAVSPPDRSLLVLRTVLAEIARLRSQVETTFLFDEPQPIATVARTLGPRHDVVTRELVEAAHALGMRVVPWTVNDVRRMAELVDLGVDGLVTDEPALAREVARSQLAAASSVGSEATPSRSTTSPSRSSDTSASPSRGCSPPATARSATARRSRNEPSNRDCLRSGSYREPREGHSIASGQTPQRGMRARQIVAPRSKSACVHDRVEVLARALLDPPHVRVDRQLVAPEREVADRRGGVWADAGKLGQVVGPAVLGDDPCRAVQADRPPVVAEPLPGDDHVGRRMPRRARRPSASARARRASAGSRARPASAAASPR